MLDLPGLLAAERLWLSSFLVDLNVFSLKIDTHFAHSTPWSLGAACAGLYGESTVRKVVVNTGVVGACVRVYYQGAWTTVEKGWIIL